LRSLVCVSLIELPKSCFEAPCLLDCLPFPGCTIEINLTLTDDELDVLKQLKDRNALHETSLKLYSLWSPPRGSKWYELGVALHSKKAIVQLSNIDDTMPGDYFLDPSPSQFIFVQSHYNVPRLWDMLRTRGTGTRIGILDSGIDERHPDFGCPIFYKSFVPGDSIPFLDDSGHGTHVAGLIHRVVPGASLICGKVLVGSLPGHGEKEWLIEGLRWMIEMQVNMINLSLGGEIPSNTVYQVILEAAARGIIIVCCATNQGKKSQLNIHYPARYGHVLCIGSHTVDGERSSYSSIGRELDCLAIGQHVVSSYPRRLFRNGTPLVPGGEMHQQAMSGTSMATPIVTGVLALFNSYSFLTFGKFMNTYQARELVQEMCTKLGHHDQEYGYGIFNPWIFIGRGEQVLHSKLALWFQH
jgi:subtilisin family serine protease